MKSILKLSLIFIVGQILLFMSIKILPYGQALTVATIGIMLVWVLFVLTFIVTIYRNHKDIKSVKNIFLTLVLLIISSPLFIYTLGFVSNEVDKEIHGKMTEEYINYENHKTFKKQVWRHRNGQLKEIKFWTGIGDNFKDSEQSYIKDSVWSYFDKDGNLIKLVDYRNK